MTIETEIYFNPYDGWETDLVATQTIGWRTDAEEAAYRAARHRLRLACGFRDVKRCSRYPIHIVDTRMIENPMGTHYRAKVLCSDPTRAFDMVVPHGSIGVAFSDDSVKIFTPDEAEEFWATRLVD